MAQLLLIIASASVRREHGAMADLRGATTFQTSAEAYDRHIGRYGPALARALIDAANVSAGQRALDIGCGPGALTAALCEVLGPDHVTAIDPSEPFVEACVRRRPGVDVRLGSAESLPFADHSFDVTLAQLVVNFMSDPRAGVGEMRRVTRPGGIVAAAVWDYAGEMTVLRRFWDAAVRFDPDAADRDEGRSMPYCTPVDLETLWRSAGLLEPATSAIVVDAEYGGFEDLWQSLEHGSGPSTAHAASLPPERRVRLRDEFRRLLDAGEGPFRLTARAWSVVGTAP
ncbi:MAG TPA: methyltransferase domain-containing protein [Nocardioidaceae bacterium]|nr:methyltransferase domain-containing protein [Nocardioidaceae bacterium]